MDDFSSSGVVGWVSGAKHGFPIVEWALSSTRGVHYCQGTGITTASLGLSCLADCYVLDITAE